VLHGLRPSDRDVLRRGIGLLLVAAFVLLLVGGMVHALDLDHAHGEAHECGACVALAQISVALPVFVVVLLFRAAAIRTVPLRRAVPIRSLPTARPPPARGPPVRR
jgi:hypothetical protein